MGKEERAKEGGGVDQEGVWIQGPLITSSPNHNKNTHHMRQLRSVKGGVSGPKPRRSPWVH